MAQPKMLYNQENNYSRSMRTGLLSDEKKASALRKIFPILASGICCCMKPPYQVCCLDIFLIIVFIILVVVFSAPAQISTYVLENSQSYDDFVQYSTTVLGNPDKVIDFCDQPIFLLGMDNINSMAVYVAASRENEVYLRMLIESGTRVATTTNRSPCSKGLHKDRYSLNDCLTPNQYYLTSAVFLTEVVPVGYIPSKHLLLLRDPFETAIDDYIWEDYCANSFTSPCKSPPEINMKSLNNKAAFTKYLETAVNKWISTFEQFNRSDLPGAKAVLDVNEITNSTTHYDVFNFLSTSTTTAKFLADPDTSTTCVKRKAFTALEEIEKSNYLAPVDIVDLQVDAELLQRLCLKLKVYFEYVKSTETTCAKILPAAQATNATKDTKNLRPY